MPQKRLFGVSLLQTVSRRYYFRARFPVVLCKSVFRRIFLLYTFFAVQEALHTQKTTCAFYARQKRRQELSFSKVADFVEIREKQKTKNQLSKRSSDKYSLLHTGF